MIEKISLCMFVFLTTCYGDTFTSIREMETLFDLEQNLVGALHKYLIHANFELGIMEDHYKELLKIESEIKDIDSYSANPVNAYSVVRRLVKDWPATFKLMSGSPFFEDHVELPDRSELIEMISKLVKWQIETGTKTKTLARGQLEAIMPHANLTAGDCYDIGVYCYHKGHLKLAVQWMREALHKITNSSDNSASLVSVLEYSFMAKCLSGDLEGSISTYHILQTEAVDFYTPSKELRKEYQLKKIKKCKGAALKRNKIMKSPLLFINNDISNELCHSDLKPADGHLCYYIHFFNPYLLLQPSKVEVIHYQPMVAIIHGVLSDDDILNIKEGALTKLDALTSGQNGPVVFPYEVMSEVLDNRVSNLTNIKVDYFTEDYLATIFGPKGIYKTVNDFQLEVDNKSQVRGKVIGKIMYFLNDVPKGGRTVFPGLKLAVTPQQGSVLYWTNPVIDGYKDNKMMEHGECPVILGSKWVLSKTIIKLEEEE